MPKIIVVVLNYSRPQETIECIASLKKSNYSNFEILIVDNASPDDSVKRICSEYPDIYVLTSQNNLGYAGGMNNGIRHALQYCPTYIMVINSDTLVDQDCLGLLVRELEADPLVAASSGVIYYQSDQKKIWYAGGDINYYRSSAFQRNGILDERNIINQQKSVTFLSGCAFLVRTSILKELGLFDERFFMYLEDTEFSERITRNNYKLSLVPQAKIYHRVTIGPLTPFTIYFNVRNRLLFVSISFNLFQKIIGFSYLFIVFTLKFIVWKIIKPPLANAIICGVQDFFSKRFFAGRGFQFRN